MERMFEVAAGLDVHRDTVAVSVRRRLNSREEVKTRTFGTFHDDLNAMGQWLREQGAEVVGLESTGVYWQPVVRAVGSHLAKALLWLVNPLDVCKVPGREIDV